MKGLVDRFRHRLFWALPTVHTFQLQAGQDGVFSFTNIKARAGVRTMWTSGRLCQGVIATSAICCAPYSSVALSAVCPLPSCWAIPCLSVPICRPWQRFGQRCWTPVWACSCTWHVTGVHDCWLLSSATSCYGPHAFFSLLGSEDGHVPGCPLGSQGLFRATGLRGVLQF